MSDPSSISSSEPRSRRAGGARSALLWTLGVLCALRAALALAPAPWNDATEVLSARELLRGASERSLRVVVFGSSHLHSAFLAEEWARRAQLRQDEIAPLAVDGGDFWDARYMLRGRGALPGSVELVIVEASRWSFNRNRIDALSRLRVDYPPLLRHEGNLRDRWSVDRLGDRVQLLGEMVWPIYQRRTLEQWITTLSSTPVRAALPRPSVHWNEAWQARLAGAHGFQPDTMVRDHFNDPRMSAFARRNFADLVREARRGGARVVIVTLPTRDAYVDAIHADPERAAFVASIDALIASLLEPGMVEAIRCERASDCALDEAIFVDYGHLHRTGARAFTAALFERVAALPMVDAAAAGRKDHAARREPSGRAQ